MQTNRDHFLETLYGYYTEHGRHDMPWRIPEADGSFDPYKILVSELMLQQTQVARVIPKYHEFLAHFPTVQTLAQAPLADVLKSWSGLGYNRRAKFLWQAAQHVQTECRGQFPEDLEGLVKLPGVGKNTAGAVLAYAFNQPAIFVETNVRTVYIHHFFHDRTDIPDGEILELLTATIDRQQPRIFYWALMDYGTHLKQTVGNLSRHSRSYARQSPFEGSARKVRGNILRLLGTRSMTFEELAAAISDDRLPVILSELQREQLISRDDDSYLLG